MPGYANRTVRREFPELSEPGDLVYVVLRNPTTVPLETLTGPEGTGAAEQQANPGLFAREVAARMIVDWHVYDAFGDGPDQEPLPLPATPESVAKLAIGIRRAINAVLYPDPTLAG